MPMLVHKAIFKVKFMPGSLFYRYTKMTSTEEFRKFGKEMIDYVADYIENIRERVVLPSVEPNYLSSLLPAQAPTQGEDWKDLMKDVENIIMPGVTHWRHPNFHAYFTNGVSGPSIIADILSASISCVGFSWIASPVCTELEMVMMDWVAKLLDLPEHFLFSTDGPGGGVIQVSASDAVLVSVLAARSRQVPKGENSQDFSKLVAYASDQAHCSVERASLLAGVKIRLIHTDENYSMRGETLLKAIKEDKEKGLVPFHCTATLGTTASCAFDNLRELGEICNEENIWLHTDAAYAGSAFVCEEFRHYMDGVELVDSFNFNLHKWMLVNFDCSGLWLKNSNELVDPYNVDPLYLKHENQGQIPDYRHWQIPLERRFRSLKVWFVLRLYGKEGIQTYIRQGVQLAKDFELLVRNDDRFEICVPVIMGLVCFRLKGKDELTEKLNKRIKDEKKVFMVPAQLRGKYMLRFAITSSQTQNKDIHFAVDVIKKHAGQILCEENIN